MTNAAQIRATKKYRARLKRLGLKRFEVTALETDRDLVRVLARRLAEGGPKADKVRLAVKALVTDEPKKSGGILSALRRSPLVGAELDLLRPRVEGRGVAL